MTAGRIPPDNKNKTRGEHLVYSADATRPVYFNRHSRAGGNPVKKQNAFFY
jgi:hypothetical protein